MTFKQQLERLFENVDEKYLELATRYENGDKSVEQELRKMVEEAAKSMGYVLVWRAVRGNADPLKPRAGYQLTFSTSKEVAESYLEDVAKEALPFYILDLGAREFRVRPMSSIPGMEKNKGNDFSKTGFDEAAGTDVVVARQVYDAGPFASKKRSPEMLWSYPSDIYATKTADKNVKFAKVITKDDENNIIPLSRRFNEYKEDVRY